MARPRGNGATVVETDGIDVTPEPRDAAEALDQLEGGPEDLRDLEREEREMDPVCVVNVNVTASSLAPEGRPISVWFPSDSSNLSAEQALQLYLDLKDAYDLVNFHRQMKGPNRAQAVPASR